MADPPFTDADEITDRGDVYSMEWKRYSARHIERFFRVDAIRLKIKSFPESLRLYYIRFMEERYFYELNETVYTFTTEHIQPAAIENALIAFGKQVVSYCDTVEPSEYRNLRPLDADDDDLLAEAYQNHARIEFSVPDFQAGRDALVMAIGLCIEVVQKGAWKVDDFTDLRDTK